jgi:hypothetical protein
VVKHAAIPVPGNTTHPLQRSNPRALQNEFARHLNEDTQLSAFDIALQFLDSERMTYWGRRQDANFWTENASVGWKEMQAPFHKVARLTLLPKSQIASDGADAIYFDVAANSTPDSAPVGSSSRARQQGEVASRTARLRH